MSETIGTAEGAHNEVEINSVSGGAKGQCIQMTQRIKPRPGMQGHIPFDNVKMDEEQVRQTVAIMQAWLVGRGLEAIKAGS